MTQLTQRELTEKDSTASRLYAAWTSLRDWRTILVFSLSQVRKQFKGQVVLLCCSKTAEFGCHESISGCFHRSSWASFQVFIQFCTSFLHVSRFICCFIVICLGQLLNKLLCRNVFIWLFSNSLVLLLLFLLCLANSLWLREISIEIIVIIMLLTILWLTRNSICRLVGQPHGSHTDIQHKSFPDSAHEFNWI